MKNKIYYCINCSICMIILFGLSYNYVQAQQDDRPNILFFLVDDLGMMDIGAYNPDTFYETPNIDRLAKSGVSFTDAYGTNPVCSPSRFSIMTGKYPSRHDATNWFCGDRSGRFLPAEMNCYMPKDEFTIAQSFQEAGYKTFFAGKWHLGNDPEKWPENQGFDINKGGWTYGSPGSPGQFSHYAPYNNPRLEEGPEGEYLVERLTDEVTQFLQDHDDEPFFAFFSFYQVHTPLEAPDHLVEKYEKKSEELGLKDVEVFAEEEQAWPTDDPRLVRVVQNHPVYAAMVESMDTAIGRVLDELKNQGYDENTIIIFTSDDGGLATSEGHPTSNQPLRGGKGWVYEGGLRGPLIINWPGVTTPGSKSSLQTISTDFYPTLLQMAGIPFSEEQHKDGVSIVPVLKGEQELLDRDALFWHYPNYSNQGGFPGGAIRMDEWKLIERYENVSVHLFNLVEDIEEQNDLAQQYPEKKQEMREKLHEWYKEVDAKFLRPKEGGPEPWYPGKE